MVPRAGAGVGQGDRAVADHPLPSVMGWHWRGASSCFAPALALLLMLWQPGRHAVPRPASAQAGPVTEDTLRVAPFGLVHVYRPAEPPAQVVLFLSGDGGWNLGVVGMARTLAASGALVIGVDVTTYLKAIEADRERCAYPAGDLETLSHHMERRYDFPAYETPILVGYSSGATLAYVILAEAPPNTFRGGLSLGFCPDLTVRKPFCRGSGLEARHEPARRGEGAGYLFRPASRLSAPWVVLHGDIDEVCSPGAVAEFVGQTGNAELVRLPHVGHGFSVARNWMPQFLAAFDRLTAESLPPPPAAGGDVAGLPLIEVPAMGAGAGAGAGAGETFAVIISGDGGWASIDRSLAEALAPRGIPVVGLDALRYFWTRRTPDGAADDLARIMDHYMDKWQRQRVLLIGYSLGADVLPFLAARLPPALKDRTVLVALVGPSHRTDFEFHVTEWLPGGAGTAPYAVLPAVEQLTGLKVLCLYGGDDADTICPALDRKRFDVVELPGGHHFNGDYARLADIILRAAR
jgi:type IV secretory pathway VirJ component